MSELKEPMFFAYEGEHKPWAVDTWEDYVRLFSKAENFQAIGEASTLYLWHHRAPDNIRLRLPDARLVAVLRNPMERAFSQFMFQRLLKSEPLETFEEALAAEEQRAQNPKTSAFLLYRELGRYAQRIARYQTMFSHEQLLFILNEDLRDHPFEVFAKVFKFIGVDPGFTPVLGHHTNPSGIVRRTSLFHGLKATGRMVKRIIPEYLALQLSGLLNQHYLVHQEIAPDTYRRLLQDFRQDIVLTQTLIGRDLSDWLATL